MSTPLATVTEQRGDAPAALALPLGVLPGDAVPSVMPRRFPYHLFLLLMLLDVVAMLAEKGASIHAQGEGLGLVAGFLTQPWLYVVLGAKLSQLFTWTTILSRVDISLAFPFTAVHIPVVMVMATIIFGEHLDYRVWIGAALITVGVMVIGPTHESSRPDSGLSPPSEDENPSVSVHCDGPARS